MKAFINGIEIVNINDNKDYFKIKLVDEECIFVGIFCELNISNGMNINCFDLLRLSLNIFYLFQMVKLFYLRMLS